MVCWPEIAERYDMAVEFDPNRSFLTFPGQSRAGQDPAPRPGITNEECCEVSRSILHDYAWSYLLDLKVYVPRTEVGYDERVGVAGQRTNAVHRRDRPVQR